MDALQYSMLEDGVRKQVDKVQNYANELGVNLVFDTNAGSDGMYDPNSGTAIIDPNSDLGALTVFTHELTHGTESSRFYEPLKNMILNENTPESVAQGVQRIKEVYSNDGVNLDDDGALKEYVAIQTQELLGNDTFVKHLVKYNNSLAYRIYDEIKHLVSKSDKYSQNIEYNFKKAFYDKENIVLFSDGVKFSKSENFAKTIHNIANGRYYEDNNNAILVDIKSPDWMVSSGYEQLPMLMTYDHAKNAMGIGKGKHQHHISEEVLSNLPELIKQPIVAYKDNNDLIVFLKATDKNGNVIKVAIKPNGRGYYESELLESNFIKSVYGKENIVKYFDKVINDDNLIYPLGKNKKEVLSEILETQSLYNFDVLLDKNISDFGRNVKKFSKGLNSKDLTESSFKTLSKDYNIKDPKLRELYDEMIDDIKTSGIVFRDTHDNIVDYIVNNSKEKVENSLNKVF